MCCSTKLRLCVFCFFAWLVPCSNSVHGNRSANVSGTMSTRNISFGGRLRESLSLPHFSLLHANFMKRTFIYVYVWTVEGHARFYKLRHRVKLSSVVENDVSFICWLLGSSSTHTFAQASSVHGIICYCFLGSYRRIFPIQ